MEDISGAFSSSTATPDARDDTDLLPAGSHGPATGNVITGAGTTSGKAGADVTAGGHVVAVRGSGGTDASDNGSSLHVEGRYGVLTLEAHGAYKYTPNAGAPDNVRDLFQYTLANAKGGRDTADLVIELGGGAVKVNANAQQVVPGPDGLITLPPGVDLTDVHVVGRDLVIDLPNGQQMVIVDGAVFVPQLVIGGVEVPASNVAELLIDSEIRPAAGPPQSSGGNFADFVPPLDPGAPLGDLIPPTAFDFPPIVFEEPGQFIRRDEPPTLVIVTPDNPAGAVNATESVNEKGLPVRGAESEGSGEAAAEGANGDATETNTGTIVFTTPDGFGSVAINGTVVTGNGQTIAGQFGTITITAYNPGAGTVGYSYTLSDNTSGDATHDVFAIVATDQDGDTATGSLTVNIIDDVPTARNDSGSQASQDAAVTVNVINNDTPGADSVNISSGVALVTGSLTGHGAVVYNNNGTFTYTPSAGEDGTVTFQYRITDGDGDTSVATVTITLLADAVPTISISGDQSVNEAGLPARGSEPEGSGEAAAAGVNGDPSETAVGTINVNTGSDTVGSLIINGVNVTAGGVVNGASGALTVTFSGGVYSYSYTLADNTLNTNGSTDTFSVTVTDNDGDTASTSLVISIVDDVPTAHNDSGTQASQDAPVTVNVIANDVQGADSVNLSSGVALVAGSLSGTGSVLYNNNGTFTYTPGAGEEGTVTFQYRITDGDGDTSVATVTITLLADSVPTVGISGDQSVNEAGLPVRGSESEGSGEAAAAGANGDTSETAVGNINITTGSDTVGSLIVGGVNVTAGGTVNGVNGVLTVTLSGGVYSYSYTLSDNTSGDATSDTFSVTVTDSDGDTATTSLVISIVDDVPTAHDDSGTQSVEDAPVTVNVIANDVPGADSVNLNGGVALVAGSLSGTGSVLYNNDGTFTYTPGAGEQGTVTFQYRITDGDGDTSVATVTITLLADSTPTVGVSGDQSVNEAGLPVRGSESEGSGEAAAAGANGDTSETAVGNINITTGGDTLASLIVGGVNVTAGGTVNGTNGILTVSVSGGVYSYSYTLSDNTTGDATSDTFSVTVTDSDGDTASTSLVISIVDDVPTAHNDSGTQSAENQPITVNVIANDVPGADSVSLTTGVALVPLSLTGTGSVLYNNNGTFTYTPGAGEEGTVTFQYRITDGDGDTSVATVTITLLADSVPTVGISGDQSVNEAGLPARGAESQGSGEAAAAGANGDTSETAVGNINVTTGNDTVASLIVGGVNVTAGGTVNGANGILTVTFSGGVYSYSYTLSDNTSGDATSDTFSVKVTDSDGDTATTSLVISIVDDVPTAHNDSGTQSAEDAPITVNVINNDVQGADSVSLTTGVALVPLSLTGTGSVLYNNNGTFTYTPTAGEQGTVTFQYRITDGDGDTSIATVTITLLGDSTPTVGITGDQSVNEAGLPVRGSESEGSGEAAAAGANGDTTETAVGNINVTTGNDTLASLIVGGVNVTAGGTVNGANGVLTVTLSAGVYSYSYTLSDNTTGDATSDTFSVKVTDSDGDTATTSLVISIVDDVPTAHNDSGTQSGENLPVTVNVIANDVPGADSVSLTTGVALVAGSNTGTGGIVYNNNGTFTYTPGAGEQGTVTFQYRITDGDGDTSVATVTITLLADSTPTVGVSGDQSVNEAGLPVRGSESEGSGEAAAAGANGDTSETAVGNINITTGGDTLASLIVGGVNVTAGGTVNGTNGILTVSVSGGVYSYSYTLSDNTTGDATSDTFSVKVTDSDGDTATTSLVISIVDDVPTAHNDSGTQSAENQPITVNVIANDVPGADSVSLTTGVALVPLSLTGTGSVLYNNNGTFTYTPGAGESGTVTFQYRITDGDGDTSVATVTITLLADSVPQVTNGVAAVDDDGLAGGNAASVTGDLDANAGEAAPVNPSEAIFHGQLVASGGGDTITAYSFAAMGGTSGTVGTETVNYAWNGGTNTLTATGPRGVLFTVVVNPTTGSYNLTLVDNVLHAVVAGENDATTNLTFTVTDSDGDSATGTIVVTFDDDAPSNFSPVDLIDDTNATVTTQDNALVNDGNANVTRLINDANNDGVGENFMGADGFGSLVFSGGVNGAQLQSSGGDPLTSGGAAIFVFGWGTGTLTATTDATNTNLASVVFTATLNAGAGYGSASTYTIDFNHAIDNGGGFVFDDFGTAPAGQNVWIGLDSDGNAIDVDNNDSGDILITGTAGGSVNTSSSDIGSNNQWIDGGEGIRIDYVTDVRHVAGMDEKDANGYNFDGHYTVTGTSFTVMQGGPASVRIQAVLDPDTGTIQTLGGPNVQIDASSIVVTNGGVVVPPAGYTVYNMGDGSFIITGLDAGDNVAFDTNGLAYNAMVVTSAADVLNTFTLAPGDTFGGSHFSLGAFGFLSAQQGDPIDLSLGVTATDADGDTATGTIDITLVPTAVPVVLDLDGDGVEFLGLNAGVHYDYAGDGHAEATAWAGPDDAILVHDANGNGTVDNASEFVFGGNGVTDLAALAAYDTNHDGQLSSADADFGSFAVWQDANSNGVVDAGEMSSLTARGIVSISLSSDGIAYSAANGDVEVAGTGSFTYANGSTGALADAAFATGNRGEQAKTAQANEANATILAAALAAAGLAAEGASASNKHADGDGSAHSNGVAGVHNEALAPVALESTSAKGSSFVEQGSVTSQVAVAAKSSPHASDEGQSHSADNSAAARSQGPTELLQGTEAPVHNEVVAQTPMTAAAVAMPAPTVAGADRGEPVHNEVVAKVLVDALHGGGGGTIDALINSLPSKGGESAHDMLASHMAAGVSNGDTGIFAGFQGGHMALTMESMVVHQDAVPAHA